MSARCIQGSLWRKKQPSAMEIVIRNATSLTQIVEDVLDVSRIISGKLRLEVQPVELPIVVEQAVETMRPAAEARGVQITTILDPNVSPVSGDPRRLRQVFWNLCSNAVKFTERGGRVEGRPERVNSHVEVSVTRSGIGIAPTFLPHVFERFRQAEGGITRAHGGLGLGLAISRHLLELQGGRIFAESEGVGKGSRFRIELPLRSVGGYREPASVLPQRTTSNSPIFVPNLRGVRVLVVDDDRDALALVREIIETTGATVRTADSGTDALAKLNREVDDLIVADIGMAEMDGFELIARIRRSGVSALELMPAIALTALARSEDRIRALRSGFQLHLAKPIEPGELMAAVGSLARRRGH